MTWIRDRYAKALAELKKKTDAGDTGGKSKTELEDVASKSQDGDGNMGTVAEQQMLLRRDKVHTPWPMSH